MKKNNIQTFDMAFFRRILNTLPYFAYVDDQQNPTHHSCGLHNSIPPKALHTSMSSSRKDHPSTQWVHHTIGVFCQNKTVQNPPWAAVKKKGLDLKGGISSKPSDSPSNSKI